jgi:hypothetical protein
MRRKIGHHVVEVDQSVKVEQTHGDTAIAFSDDIQRVVLIPATVKRVCQQELRKRGVKPGMIALRIFVAGLLLLLEGQIENIASLRLDTEYEGKDGEIKGLLLRAIRDRVPDFPAEAIAFVYVGKQSPAHRLAWETHKGRRKPDRQIALEDLLPYC